jgi:hypothetical protein
MKKIFLLAASAAMIFASCSKGENTNNQAEEAQLSIRLAGAVASRGGLELPGSTAKGTISLNNGHIFVLDNLDKVIHHEALNVTAARTEDGQQLSAPVPNDSRVYVLANIPSVDNAEVAALTTLAGIKAQESEITTQVSYKDVALSNQSSQPAAITPRTGGAGGGTNGRDIYEATVQLVPLVARIELLAIEGTEDITSFTVAGVYVDDYYPTFAYEGKPKGAMFKQNQATTYNGIGFYKSEGTLVATDLDGNNKFIAANSANQVWAFNVAPESLPRLLIKLTDVKYLDENDVEQSLGEKWLTVTGYNGGTLRSFERGKIYRLGVNPDLLSDGVDGDGDGIADDIADGKIPGTDMPSDEFEFGPDDLAVTPNPKDVELYVMVEVVEWKVEKPTADL